MVKVLPVRASGKTLKAFIDYPHTLYKGDPYYVPELFIAQKDILSADKNPFYRHAEMQLFLAYKEGVVVGRIAAILNRNHNRFNDNREGFFGFFDCENDPAVASALLDAAAEWLAQKGADAIVGPVNPSTNDACGLLVEGFDSRPMIMMPYNDRYYMGLLEQWGLRKQVDLLAHALYAGEVGDKPLRLAQALSQRLENKGIVIRKIDFKGNFAGELAKFAKVYNEAWDKNLGFVPLTPEELEHMGKSLKTIADEDFCLVAEHHGEAIGICLCIPDINQIFAKIPRGRLFPLGLWKLLTQRKKINALRIMALGVLEPYRKLGIEACFYAAVMKRGLERGFQMAEASWILEHNDMMNKGIEHMNGKVYKRYRIYEKTL